METMVNPLEKRRLGQTEMNVTAMSMGGAGIGGIFGDVSDADGVAAVEKALELGMNWVDTSPFYFEAERRIGIALRGVPRERYYLSSKAGTHRDRFQDYSADAIYWSVENSLRTMGVDYLDICLIHDPLPQHMDKVLGHGGAIEALVELKGQGVIRSIGIGVRSHETIRRAIDTGHLDMALTFNDYTLLRQTVLEGVCDHADARGVSVVNGAALGMGLFSGRDPRSVGTPRWTPRQDDVAAAVRVFEWCREQNVSILGLALQFSLRQRRLTSTLIGASSAKEVEECWIAATSPIAEQTWEALNDLLIK
ncbi:aldo/keto reductase [Paenibacillus filicis]|uniref:Aldo/keto reductase n=1 Tax=Paenibacillus gyeongsangnamensis TaxID=3388067 RepID=A0ABT4QBR3_9BACL|nr:aldo/keto reductase [Paenibacillus filicis]MCZ8514332.1 aldo/keto reductase [Paenibacillus filicis]